MKFIIVICFALFTLQSSSQITARTWVEKYEDEFDNSYYPILNGELNYTFRDSSSIQFTYWSNADVPIYPYINVIVNWRKWVIAINPLKPDIYNYTIQISFYETLSFLSRRKRMVDRLPRMD